MPRPPKPEPSPERTRSVAAVRIMALVSAALAVMCVYLAHAWKTERDTAACWRAAAEFQLTPEGDCRG
ncbi:hypothetical protein [Phenylobacterium sp.]|uniref:hypothetical protein n=1 Tax=Phenylobacterium sp. TaxID=1871053 RepID=UPI0025EF22B9|nr:hypothetical protein [Phenylobacterium sp.]